MVHLKAQFHPLLKKNEKISSNHTVKAIGTVDSGGNLLCQ